MASASNDARNAPRAATEPGVEAEPAEAKALAPETHSIRPLVTDHSRRFEQFRFVYPVISRRSRGMSVGINLNPDKLCNFDCVYCQVDRVQASETRFVDLDQLLFELRSTLELIVSGLIWRHPKFATTPEAWRRLNDIAFSGDGEPTTYRNFDEIVEKCAAIKRDLGLRYVKMALITNASMFHRPHVRRGLEILDQNQGEIWAKLDAGTEAYFKTVERTSIPFSRILKNIRDAALVRPIVIQALFMRLAGEGPSASEIIAFCDRLNEVTAGGGKILRVQVYTVARKPAESYVTSLSDQEVESIGETVRNRTGLAVETFHGANWDG